MITKYLRWASYAVLIFGFMYLTWHSGRMYEKSLNQDVSVSSCITTDLETYCEQTSYKIDAYIKLYNEVMKEVKEPSDPEYWREQYKLWAQEKLGL